MYRACIAVVDASRARLFTFERSAEVGGVTEQLVERRDLVNPARRLRPVELFSESRPGISRTGSLQYGLDDHRDANIENLDTTFAKLIVDEIEALCRELSVQRIIICASPRMLGQLRSVGSGLIRDHRVDELARDLVKLTPPQLRVHLTRSGLLPEPPPRPQVRPA